MNQQINLYQPMFRKQERVFSATAMLQALIIMLVVLAAMYGYSFRQVHQLSAQLERSERNLMLMQQNLARMQVTFPPPSKLLETEIQSLSAKLAERQRVIEALKTGSLANLTGFSAFLEALARQHVPGSWLTRIELHNGGLWMRLNGQSHQPELVPSYLQRLLGEEVFAKTSFNELDIRRSAEDPATVEFEVNSGAPEDRGEKGHAG